MLRRRLIALFSALAFALAPTAALAQAQSAGSTGHQRGPFQQGGNGGPFAGTCGTAPVIAAGSTDSVGMVTIGATGTACTITFAFPYATPPFCVVSGSAAVTLTTGPSATGFIVTAAAATNVTWTCWGA